MIIEFNIKNQVLVSTNELYMPRPTRGGRSAYITKSPYARGIEEEIDRKLLELISDDIIKELSDELDDDQIAIKLMMNIELPEVDFFRVDSSNYLKFLEDRIKYRINVDDTRNVTVSSTKHINNDDKVWNTNVKLETYRLPFDIPEGRWSKKIKGGD